MKLTTIAPRAAQQKYLTPAERALYKFVLGLVVLIPSGTILAGTDAALSAIHAQGPTWLWPVIGVVLPALLFALAKYYTAQGDTSVGAILQQLESETEKDTAPSSASAPPQIGG